MADPLDVSPRHRKPAPSGSALHVANDLSGRQLEVLEMLADGVPARAIAQRLGLAEATVRNHIRGILMKLGCHSQLEAVALAFRMELVGPRRQRVREPGGTRRDPASAAARPTRPQGRATN